MLAVCASNVNMRVGKRVCFLVCATSTFVGNWSKVYGKGYDMFKALRKELDPAGIFLNQFAKDLGL